MLLGIATHGGAAVMKDTGYGLEVGKHADFVLVPGDAPSEAIIGLPLRTAVFKNGRLVAEKGVLT